MDDKVDHEQTRQGTRPSRQALPRALDLVVALLALVVIAAHARLIPIGYWKLDEFHDFGLFRNVGWSFFWQRLLTWSPRPFSESLIGLYFLGTERAQRALIEPALGILWLLLAAAVAGFVVRGRGERSWPRLLLCCAVLAMFLLGHRLAEMFFWTLGAMAYMTTLAGITLLTCQFLDGRWRAGGGRVGCILTALAVAGSAEVGAVFTFVFSVTMVVLGSIGVLGQRRIGWPWLLPLLAATILLGMLAAGRGRLEEHVYYLGHFWSPALLGHPLASLARSAPTIMRQLAGLDAMASGAAELAWGVAIKVAFFVGALGFLQRIFPLRPDRAARVALWGLLFSLLATFVLSVAGAYYKFGVACCERHDTLRQCLLVLAEVVAAALLAGVVRWRWPRVVGPAVLAAALIALSVQRWPDLQDAYAAGPTLQRAQRATWASGTASGDRMTFRLPALPPLIGGFAPPERVSYSLDGNPPWMWQLVMEYFNKRAIEVVPEPP